MSAATVQPDRDAYPHVNLTIDDSTYLNHGVTEDGAAWFVIGYNAVVITTASPHALRALAREALRAAGEIEDAPAPTLRPVG